MSPHGIVGPPDQSSPNLGNKWPLARPLTLPNFIVLGQTMYEKRITIFHTLQYFGASGDLLGQSSRSQHWCTARPELPMYQISSHSDTGDPRSRSPPKFNHLFTGLLPTFRENFMQIWKYLCKVANRQTDKQTNDEFSDFQRPPPPYWRDYTPRCSQDEAIASSCFWDIKMVEVTICLHIPCGDGDNQVVASHARTWQKTWQKVLTCVNSRGDSGDIRYARP